MIAKARPRWYLLAAALSTIALVFVTSDAVGKYLPFNFANRGADLAAFYAGVHSFVSGGGPNPYTMSPPLFYPAPYVGLLAPLGLLSADGALLVARLLAALCLAATVYLWTDAGEKWNRDGRAAWILLLSLPSVALVYLGQLPAALGLVGFSLAIWAQRRDLWWLVGVALGLGLIRLTNAPPVVAVLLLGAWSRPVVLMKVVGGAALVLAPLVSLAQLWSDHWFPDYVHALSQYTYIGPIWKLALDLAGPAGVVALLLLGFGIGFAMLRRSAGGALDGDRAAAALALSVLTATLPAVYAVAFAIPAVVRLSLRASGWLVVALALLLPWVAVLPPVTNVAPAYIAGPVVAVLIAIAAIAYLTRAEPAPA